MYYIYHIPGIKIGCTDNIKRRMREQNFEYYEILETYEDGWIAGDRELILQEEYGLPIDKIHYMQSRRNVIKASNANKGISQSIEHINKRRIHLIKPKSIEHKVSMSISRKDKPKVKLECPYCNKIIGGQSNFNRWHGDNCKHKKGDQI